MRIPRCGTTGRHPFPKGTKRSNRANPNIRYDLCNRTYTRRRSRFYRCTSFCNVYTDYFQGFAHLRMVTIPRTAFHDRDPNRTRSPVTQIFTQSKP